MVDLDCCLQSQCAALHTCCLGFPITTGLSSLSLDQFYQPGLLNGKITPSMLLQNKHCHVKFWKCQNAVSILPHEAKKHTWFYMGGSGLDRTNDFQRFWGSGLDWTQFLQIRIGLGLKNFTVRSSLSQRWTDLRSRSSPEFLKLSPSPTLV